MMAGWPDGGDVDEADLVLGEELGRGGQGRVVRVEGPEPGYVFKRYTVPGADPVALKDLVELPASLQPADQARLRRWAAWPLARVLRDGTLSGFVMREIPDPFLGRDAAGRAGLRELHYLLSVPKPAWGAIRPLDVERRIVIAREFALLVRLLHDRRLVIGDISMSNLLWSDTDPPGVFLLDCDGIRRLGARPVLPQAETPDWRDPIVSPGGLDLAGDRYKLALVVGRLLTGTAGLHPGPDLPLLPGLPERIVRQVTELWVHAAGPRGTRPDPQQWVTALSDRREIALPVPPPVRRRPSIPLAEIEGTTAHRASIPLRPVSPESG
jgi:hypothetical protein